jgi:hypothetical protein
LINTLGFNSAAWKLGVVGVVGLLVWYEWDQRIQQQGQTNPIAKFFADYFPSATLWEDRNAQHYRLVQSAAQDQLLVRTMTRPPIRRLTDTMAFDRGSPFGVPVGSQADLSDLKIRTD